MSCQQSQAASEYHVGSYSVRCQELTRRILLVVLPFHLLDWLKHVLQIIYVVQNSIVAIMQTTPIDLMPDGVCKRMH